MLVFEPIQARWEASLVQGPVAVDRAKIPGGWLVGLVSGSVNFPTMLCFVPDPEHRWDGSSLPEAKGAE